MVEREMPTTYGNVYIVLVNSSLLLVFVVIVLSAYIRLSNAGLGCAEWPAC